MRGGASISHLFFADDCILYSRAILEDWKKIQTILSLNEKDSGQTLNKQKSSIIFSPSTPERVKQQISQVTGSFICGNFSKYLGLPTIVGYFKYNTFRLKDRI